MNRLKAFDEKLLSYFSFDGWESRPEDKPYKFRLTLILLLLAGYTWTALTEPHWHDFVLASLLFVLAVYQARLWWRARNLK